MSDSASARSTSPPPDATNAVVSTKQLLHSTALDEIQTKEQRRVLDTVAQLRKCGCDGELELPQIVVCGDQSSGKSSVIEALTGVKVPTSDNLCTRFATEISLRRANIDSLSIKINPSKSRSASERVTINKFEATIADFSELPGIIEKAKAVMGLSRSSEGGPSSRSFARDVLSITIEGPQCPHLTIIDIPGLIKNATKGQSQDDVNIVAEITDHYILQDRTICLAVIAASNDYANQGILTKVTNADPEGNRTIGVITKPDIPPEGSDSEKAFISLARNEDIFFKLGWHVVRNRKYEEKDFTLEQRNDKEESWLRKSNYNCLPAANLGINSLRDRLGLLLFDHIKRELPKLRQELESSLGEFQRRLAMMGKARSSTYECRAYLTELSVEYRDVCKAAINGHYEGEYFNDHDQKFDIGSPATLKRTRAVVQLLNTEFAKKMDTEGYIYKIDLENKSRAPEALPFSREINDLESPTPLTKAQAIDWVRELLVRGRGKELVGNFNPLVISELFWEQSSKWETLAADHLERVAACSTNFLSHLLNKKCPDDVEARIWSEIIEEKLNQRAKAAREELRRLTSELKAHPINYNHYYTETIAAGRKDDNKEALAQSIRSAIAENGLDGPESSPDGVLITERIDVEKLVDNYYDSHEADMENYSCEEALRCLEAIYKVSLSPFLHLTCSS